MSRRRNVLRVDYSLVGEIENILFPASSLRPTRKDELWRTTCLEFFFTIPDGPQYWEFNMSPSGDWNVYHMDAYRRVGVREETSIQQLPFAVQKDVDCLSLKVSVDLSPIIRQENIVQVGISSVIQTKDEIESYWALAHPNPQPDFHSRECFILVLAE